MPADSTNPSRFIHWSLQLAHRAATIALFLLIAAIALRYFQKDAALVLPGAIVPAGLATVIGAVAWWRARRADRNSAEARGVTIVGALLLMLAIAGMILWHAGKS